MKYFTLLLKQYFIVLNFSSIPLSKRVHFLFNYSWFIFFVFLFNPHKKIVKFFDNSFFSFFGTHKNLLMDHVVSHIKLYSPHYLNAKTIIDVGSSFGDFSLMANLLNKKAQIYAIEMSKVNSQFLITNLKGRKNISVFNNAVGDVKKVVSYVDATDFPEGSKLINRSSKKPGYETVDQITLSDFIVRQKIKRVSLLKIDTEGSEVLALKGLGNKISICEKIIVETDFKTENLLKVIQILSKSKFTLIGIADINFEFKSKLKIISSADLIFKNDII